MKKVKLLALLACMIFALSMFAVACTTPTTSEPDESTTSEQLSDSEVSTPESEPESEEESVIESEEESIVESEPESEEESVEPTTYSVTFMADGVEVEVLYYTEDAAEIIEPTVPAKDGYNAAWEAYELNMSDIVVNAVYEAIVYTVTFEADGVDPITFTVETMADVVFPEPPHVEGYATEWDISEEDLTLEDVTVNLILDKLFTIRFTGTDLPDVVMKGSELDLDLLPEAPEKEGYLTGWGEPIIDMDNAVIEFVYWEMTEREYYTRDIQGAEMAHALQPVDESNSVEWDETENAYHFINTLGNTQADDRAVIFNPEYFDKMVEFGLMNISFEVKIDAVVEGEIIYRGFYPDWYGEINKDWWQHRGAQDWISITIDVTTMPKTAEGALKSIFMLADQGSGLLIRNIKVWAPDLDNLTAEDLAKAFIPHVNAPQSSVSVDATEGGLLFNVDPKAVENMNNDRAFTLNKHIYDALLAQGPYVRFKAKFLAPKPEEDGTLYVSFVTVGQEDWWGAHTGIGYTADGYVEFHLELNRDPAKTLFLLCASGNFMIKDFEIYTPEGWEPPVEVPEDLSQLTPELIARAFKAKSALNSVSWDATEGAWLFTNVISEASNNRAFRLHDDFYAALKSLGTTISFKVKFLRTIEDNDGSIYVSYATDGDWGDWWGRHQQIFAQDGWVTVTTSLSNLEGDSLFLLCASGSFMLKDIEFITPSQVTTVAEFDISAADVKVDGLDSNAKDSSLVVDNAPAGVNGTAIKFDKAGLYAGGAIAFSELQGEILPEYMVSLRIYVASTAGSTTMWFYNPEDTAHGGSAVHITKENIATNQWVDVTFTLSELATLVNAEGKFVGLQFGFFAAGGSALYIDSLAVVTVVDVPDIPLFPAA